MENIFLLIMLFSGSGKSAVVLPFHYETREECTQAAQEAKAWDFFCVEGPKPNPSTTPNM